MRIAFLTRLFYPHIGGVEKHVLEISKLLLKDGHKVSVITELYDKGLKEFEILEGIKVYRFSFPKIKFFGLIFCWLKLVKFFKILKAADIVHAHDVAFWYFPYRLIFFKKAFFTTFHGFEGYPIRVNAYWLRKISELLSQGVIVVGSYIKKWYGVKNPLVIYGGINTETIKKSLKDKKKTILFDACFWGRFDKDTGFDTYLKTLKIIRKKYVPGFRLLAIGSGPLLPQKRVPGLKIIHPLNDPYFYISRSRVAFVSGFLSILEAFYLKKKVFATFNNPLKRDYLMMTPFYKFLVIEKSPLRLAYKVYKFLKKRKKDREIDEAFLWVKNNTWESILKVYYKLWSK